MTPAPHGPHEPSDDYFIPALRFRVLTRAYDALLSVTLDDLRNPSGVAR